MSELFPSVWIELNKFGSKKKQLISGFYRVWTHNGDKSERGQVERIKLFTEALFTDQIDKEAENKSTKCLMFNVVK